MFCNELVKTLQQPFVFPIRVAYERQARQVPAELFVPLLVAENVHSDQAEGKPPPTSLKAGESSSSSGDHGVSDLLKADKAEGKPPPPRLRQNTL